MSTTGSVKVTIAGNRNPDDANTGGALTVGAAIELLFTDGDDSADSKANRIHQVVALSVPTGAGGVELDLVSASTAADGFMNATKIRAIVVLSDPSNTDPVVIEPAGINGWIGMLKTISSDLELPVGGVVAFASPSGWAVTSGSKVLKFSHGGAGAHLLNVVILAATAP